MFYGFTVHPTPCHLSCFCHLASLQLLVGANPTPTFCTSCAFFQESPLPSFHKIFSFTLLPVYVPTSAEPFLINLQKDVSLTILHPLFLLYFSSEYILLPSNLVILPSLLEHKTIEGRDSVCRVPNYTFKHLQRLLFSCSVVSDSTTP